MNRVILLSCVLLWCVLGVLPVAGAGSGAKLSEAQSNELRCLLLSQTLPDMSLHERLRRFLPGCRLFFNETFGGNGRTCATCHLRELPGDNFDFTPADAQALFAEDPMGPLFRSIDSDDGAGSDFTLLRQHALVRIPFTLPANVSVVEPSGPTLTRNDDGSVTVAVWRSTPSIENMALEDRLLWDGRETDLAVQANAALQTHFQPDALASAVEADQLGFFQKQFFTDPLLRQRARSGADAPLPSVPSATLLRFQFPGMLGATQQQLNALRQSLLRGRKFFVSMPVATGAAERGGHCATCHSGPMLDLTNTFNPVQAPGEQIANNFVAEVNDAPLVPLPGAHQGLSLPELTYRVTLTYDFIVPPVPLPGLPPPGTVLFPAGTVFTIKSSDPGHILTSGDPCELPLACIINSPPGAAPATVSFFRTSSLWGAADSAPYFHDNSADTLQEVVKHYADSVFLITGTALGEPAWFLSAQEQTDIVNFMTLAFRRRSLP